VRFDVVTIFPEFFGPALRVGVLGRALRSGLVEVRTHQLRDYSADKHRNVDDRPYGGGPGMVLRPEPVVTAVEGLRGPQSRVLITSPQGSRFDHGMAAQLAGAAHVIIIAGRYEGYDERILDLTGAEEVSVGDFVLSGGELAALAIVEATARLVDGVLGSEESAGGDSFAVGALKGPQYTRPEEYRGLRVPEVLLSGDHAAVSRYRQQWALERTMERRPDLLEEEHHDAQ
jgi:tRNA (guanine37-N1)-methyltransferase